MCFNVTKKLTGRKELLQIYILFIIQTLVAYRMVIILILLSITYYIASFGNHSHSKQLLVLVDMPNIVHSTFSNYAWYEDSWITIVYISIYSTSRFIEISLQKKLYSGKLRRFSWEYRMKGRWVYHSKKLNIIPYVCRNGWYLTWKLTNIIDISRGKFVSYNVCFHFSC